MKGASKPGTPLFVLASDATIFIYAIWHRYNEQKRGKGNAFLALGIGRHFARAPVTGGMDVDVEV